ncbi:hypothetical protein [Corynebacterium sp. Marseille-P4321]|uniref:hypothetical protein n=1 Tax=Corynebacterium sp. Marseille-P4321 TaxID=2736603 RepID=UPI00158AA300|nr:hypothetical protein [Corynebacterium sp. Marseille-P4321]
MANTVRSRRISIAAGALSLALVAPLIAAPTSPFAVTAAAQTADTFNTHYTTNNFWGENEALVQGLTLEPGTKVEPTTNTIFNWRFRNDGGSLVLIRPQSAAAFKTGEVEIPVKVTPQGGTTFNTTLKVTVVDEEPPLSEEEQTQKDQFANRYDTENFWNKQSAAVEGLKLSPGDKIAATGGLPINRWGVSVDDQGNVTVTRPNSGYRTGKNEIDVTVTTASGRTYVEELKINVIDERVAQEWEKQFTKVYEVDFGNSNVPKAIEELELPAGVTLSKGSAVTPLVWEVFTEEGAVNVAPPKTFDEGYLRLPVKVNDGTEEYDAVLKLNARNPQSTPEDESSKVGRVVGNIVGSIFGTAGTGKSILDGLVRVEANNSGNNNGSPVITNNANPKDNFSNNGNPSVVITDNVNPKDNFSNNGNPSVVITDNVNPKDNFSNNGNPSVVITDNVNPKDNFSNNGNPSVVITDNVNPKDNFSNNGNPVVTGNANPIITGNANPTVEIKDNLSNNGNPVITGNANPNVEVKDNANPVITGNANPNVEVKDNANPSNIGNPTVVVTGNANPNVEVKDNANPMITGNANPNVEVKDNANPVVTGNANPSNIGNPSIVVTGNANPNVEVKDNANPIVSDNANPQVGSSGGSSRRGGKDNDKKGEEGKDSKDGSRLIGGDIKTRGGIEDPRCIASLVGLGVPLLSLIPIALAQATNVPELNRVSVQAAKVFDDAARRVGMEPAELTALGGGVVGATIALIAVAAAATCIPRPTSIDVNIGGRTTVTTTAGATSRPSSTRDTSRLSTVVAPSNNSEPVARS